MIGIEPLLTLLESRLGPVQAVYLFGSSAHGDATAESDVDLAVLLPSPMSDQQRWELIQELGVLYGRDVDLLDLRAASTVMRHQVTHTARRLYASDPRAVEDFEDFALSDYVRLNEERAGILADIAARGSVYDR